MMMTTIVLVAGVSVAAAIGLVGTGYFIYKFHEHNKAAADVDYPAYGVVGPAAKSPAPPDTINRSGRSSHAGSGNVSPVGGGSAGGDRKLAASAQMYHYHHQKQQITSDQSAAGGKKSRGRFISTSDADSEDDLEGFDGDDDGDVENYIVYECPGLAPTGEMEVKNPLFHDDSTPASPAKSPMKISSSGSGGTNTPSTTKTTPDSGCGSRR